MYSFMTVVELKLELRKRNASTAGKKAALIERLQAYERNFNFGSEPGPSEDPGYRCPPVSFFKDVNADSPIPPINRQEILVQSYFERFSARHKGKDMYESRCLLTVRYAVDGDYTFFQGQCKAQMKKVTYIVNVKLSKEGCIEEANCECAAGSGIQAHCKHVSVLLCAVEDIYRTNTIILHQVTTQRLMTFKRPNKAFYRSPIQAQNLPVCKKKRNNINYEPVQKEDMPDNYICYVQNLAINYGTSTMPILQTFKPANPYGIEWDHDLYAGVNSKEMILEKLFLKNVTKSQIEEIEEITREQNKSAEWHKHRSCRLTAYKFHAICHVQTGQAGLIENIMNPRPIYTRAITHGKTHESTAMNKYTEVFGLNVQKCGLFICEKYPFLAASPDGLLGDDTVIEIKCPYAARYMPINPVTVSYLQEVNGNLKLKTNHPYFTQIQGQLLCTNRKYCNFIVYTFKEMKVLFISRDDSFISEMVEKLCEFFKKFFKKEILKKYLYKNYDLIKLQ